MFPSYSCHNWLLMWALTVGHFHLPTSLSFSHGRGLGLHLPEKTQPFPALVPSPSNQGGLRGHCRARILSYPTLLCLQLQSTGRLLEEQLPEMMTELLASARDKMLCPSESMLTRSLLLEVIELHANSWNPLTPPITQYYNRTIQKLTA